MSFWKSFKNFFTGAKAPFEEDVQKQEERYKFIDDQQALSTPWAMFEIVGFESDGQIKVEFNWNQAFITHIKSLGFQGESDEDSVQLFFFTCQMRPTSISNMFDDEQDDLPINEDLPSLGNN